VVNLLGGRVASVVIGALMLALGSSGAAAQTFSSLNAPVSALVRPAVASTTAVATPNGGVLQGQPARSVSVSLRQSIANEAAWLYHAGWPLNALVDRYSAGTPLDDQASCLATAVYFEARGESLEGQMAVARVVMNRAASGRYPPDWCNVVKQPAQFSFVRHGQFPWIDTASAAWGRAQGIARLAAGNVIPSVSNDVLWYHATYVAPTWGHRLNIAEKIGAHIFYRA